MDLNWKSDAELWKDFKAGDRMALEVIYRKYAVFLLNYGRKFLKDDPADFVQDLFIELLEKRKGLAEVENVASYLITSLRNKLIKSQVIHQKAIVINNIPVEYVFDLTLSPEEDIIQENIESEKIRSINSCLECLSSRQKEALYLKFYTELTYKDIAEFMQISEPSVYNLVSKALKTMSDLLRENKKILLTLFPLLCT